MEEVMAIRNIRTLGDEILRKEAKEITEMTPRIQELIDEPVIDMEIVKDKLNISPATVKALEADGIINVKVES
jgi:peptide deformylase